MRTLETVDLSPNGFYVFDGCLNSRGIRPLSIDSSDSNQYSNPLATPLEHAPDFLKMALRSPLVTSMQKPK
jgi:hypothetical protein